MNDCVELSLLKELLAPESPAPETPQPAFQPLLALGMLRLTQLLQTPRSLLSSS